MSTLHEIGDAVRVRRTELGLTQEALARISGLSRSTINAVEKKSAANLSLSKAEKLLEAIGLSIHVPPASARQAGSRRAAPADSALDRAARTASVSYRTPMTAKQLESALLTGMAPDAIKPHLQVLLDEAPMTLLAKVVEEVHSLHGIERMKVWDRMRSFAHGLQSYRAVWW
jgi:transcriptional regulator with XRE-family HTH domain